MDREHDAVDHHTFRALKTNIIMNEPANAPLPAPANAPAPALTATAKPLPEATWEQVRRWADWAAKFERGSLACQLMAGFGLLGLREQYVERPHVAIREVSHRETPHFNKLIEKELRVSRATAYRWMAMADALRAKYGDMKAPDRMRALLSTSPKDWTLYETELVMAFVDKVTDGKTAVAYLKELGLTRPEKRVTPQPLPAPAPAAPTEKQIETAQAQWKKLRQQIEQYGNAFEVLDDDTVMMQMTLFATAARLRADWLQRRHKTQSAA